MTKRRIKISAVYTDFSTEIEELIRLDISNQTNFSDRKITKKQLYILTEFVFFNAFIAYETFIRDIFLLYTMEKKNSNNDKVTSYLRPKDFYHAEKLIQSSMNIIDWNSPETIIERAELYLKDGFPIKIHYTTNKTKLNQYKTLRNHIAHKSSKSLDSYKKVLRAYYGANPLKTPSVGEYLILTSKVDRNRYHLLECFDLFKQIAINLK